MPFEYKPRTPAQFEARERQSQFRYAAPSKPAPVLVKPDHVKPEESDNPLANPQKLK